MRSIRAKKRMRARDESGLMPERTGTGTYLCARCTEYRTVVILMRSHPG